MRVRKAIGCLAVLVAVCSGLVAGFFSFVAIHRYTLTYNEEGRYFDAVSSVVYHDGAGFMYAALAVLFWLVTGSSIALHYWLKRPN